ncbi:MAG: SpoIID/LytB domain-containing protein, partial [Blastocatellia bacterium]|nr:SpoIID/LytB domain-containing protein [Blastocatellia bacterium]
IEGMRGAVKFGTAARMKTGESYIFGKTGTSTSSNGFRTQGWFVGFLAEGNRLPREDQVRLGVLVFLKRSHGAECAEVAGKIFECGLRIADCGFKREVLNKPQHVIPAGYINSQSAIRIPHSIRVRSVGENITRELPLEEYLVGVLRGEAASEDEFEALKAQAVISRTFALKNLGRHAGEGFDFCSTTHCQRFLYSDKRSPSPVRRAVYETAGEVLRDELGCLVDGYFHAACGGVTANIRALWGVPAPSYLRGVRDDFCETMPHRRWTQTIPAVDLVKALSGDERTNVGPRLDAIVVSKRDATGRAEMLTLSGVRSRVVRGWDFKIIVGRSLGWQKIKSSRFAVTRSGSDFVFRGSGFGHGLGLCQEGAHVMASRGMNYRQILDHYFPGTRSAVSSFQFPVSSKSGFRFLNWKLETGNWKLIASEHFRASFQGEREPVESALRILEASHSDLLQRLRQASLQLAEPRPFEVVIHATTADFIASTGQSGWAAGVTRGRRIELQPLALLRKRGILTQTLRHELAHAVIEVLSEGRAPRWLSEGLAIHLSGEGAALSRSDFRQQLARAQLERKLARPAPAKVMRELYAAAYREVLALIRAEGEENVWRLVAGAKNAYPDKDNVDK